MCFPHIFSDSLAEVVPALNAFISLIGALCSTGLAMILPPVIELVCAYGGTTDRPSGFMISKNCVIIILAMFGLVTGTYESLQKLAEAFRKGSS